jgi:hypothetical protein
MWALVGQTERIKLVGYKYRVMGGYIIPTQLFYVATEYSPFNKNLKWKYIISLALRLIIPTVWSYGAYFRFI